MLHAKTEQTLTGSEFLFNKQPILSLSLFFQPSSIDVDDSRVQQSTSGECVSVLILEQLYLYMFSMMLWSSFLRSIPFIKKLFSLELDNYCGSSLFEGQVYPAWGQESLT